MWFFFVALAVSAVVLFALLLLFCGGVSLPGVLSSDTHAHTRTDTHAHTRTQTQNLLCTRVRCRVQLKRMDVTPKMLLRRARQIAHVLDASNVQEKDVVLIIIPPSPDLVRCLCICVHMVCCVVVCCVALCCVCLPACLCVCVCCVYLPVYVCAVRVCLPVRELGGRWGHMHARAQ